MMTCPECRKKTLGGVIVKTAHGLLSPADDARLNVYDGRRHVKIICEKCKASWWVNIFYSNATKNIKEKNHYRRRI